MHTLRWLSIVLTFFLMTSCDKPLPTLEGMDLQAWQADKNGCADKRHAMRDALDEEKEKLLGLNQMQVVELLGKPDKNELYSRSQKFFYYYLEPSPACGDSADGEAGQLVIRFNAVGLASEVSIQ